MQSGSVSTLHGQYTAGEWTMALAVTDRLDLIRLFLRVAETGQISEAARTLGLSQPTASRFLKRLEALLGAQLVDRSPHGLSLTQAGQDFLLPARRLAEGWHDAVDALKAEQTDISGTLRVAVPIAIGQGFLAVIAARFLQAHPHMAIDWHLRDDAVDVTGRGYDLWIRAGKVHRDDLVVRHIYRVERAIATAARGAEITHPRALQSMPAVRLSTFVPGTIALTGQGGEVFHLRQRTAFTTDNLYAALTAVLEGVGYGILPCGACTSIFRTKRWSARAGCGPSRRSPCHWPTRQAGRGHHALPLSSIMYAVHCRMRAGWVSPSFAKRVQRKPCCGCDGTYSGGKPVYRAGASRSTFGMMRLTTPSHRRRLSRR